MSIVFDFNGRTAVVTGAAHGIGFEVARFFERSGANVVALDRDEDALARAWPADERTLALGVEVADSAAVDRVVQESMTAFGSVDIMVNNAGITRDGVVWKLTDVMWNDVLAVHLTGTFNFTRAVVPHMRAASWGRIVNVTSYTGLRGNIGQANYAAAKAGIIGFTKSTAKELARFGITVNAISPNAETAMVAAIPPAKRDELIAQIPMARFAHPSEMATTVGFLASDEASYITGTVLPVDGGISI